MHAHVGKFERWVGVVYMDAESAVDVGTDTVVSAFEHDGGSRERFA